MTKYNLNEETEDFPLESITAKVSPTQKLQLAKKILTSVMLLALLSIFVRAGMNQDNEAAKDIFETAKTILPAIATLVIGYYFGRNETQ